MRSGQNCVCDVKITESVTQPSRTLEHVAQRPSEVDQEPSFNISPVSIRCVMSVHERLHVVALSVAIGKAAMSAAANDQTPAVDPLDID